MEMIVSITVNLNTDGDFSLRKSPDMDSAFSASYRVSNDEDEYYLTRWYKVDESDSLHDEMVFLEKILCELHISYTHHYLIGCLYDLFDEAINAVSLRNDYYASLNGNYEGTFVRVDFE